MFTQNFPMKPQVIPVLCAGLLFCAVVPARAIDLTGGVMQAVPTKNGVAPKIDGDLSDFDLSRAEPIVISTQTARRMNAQVALNYDQNALYIAAKVGMPNRRIHNPNNPQDAFWWGDVLEFRVAADPSLPKPLQNGVNSDRVAHLTMWKNSETGKDFLFIGYGVNIDKGSAANPTGTQIVIKEQGTTGYTLEARVPWSVLHAPGGVNPFKPGQSMTAVWSPHWGGEMQVAALYRRNPGSFAFNAPDATIRCASRTPCILRGRSVTRAMSCCRRRNSPLTRTHFAIPKTGDGICSSRATISNRPPEPVFPSLPLPTIRKPPLMRRGNCFAARWIGTFTRAITKTGAKYGRLGTRSKGRLCAFMKAAITYFIRAGRGIRAATAWVALSPTA